MSETINNGIPFVPENTIDPAAGLNIALNDIDALLQLRVVTFGLTVAPTGVEGERHIVGVGATGDWVGQDNKMALFQDGLWRFKDACYCVYQDALWTYDGTEWSEAGAAAVADHVAEVDPHPQYTTTAEAAAASPVQSVNGKTGSVDLSGDYEAKRQNNLTANTDPTASDDDTAGYEPLSRWINTVTGEIWLCISAATGAANWQQATLTIDELGSASLADIGTGSGQVPVTGDYDPAGSAAAAQAYAIQRANHTGTQPLSTISDAGTAASRDASGAGDVYARGGILGTVSRSGGMPTGAIIERGSNSDGEYVKFADGTLIMYGIVDCGSIVANGNGTLASPYASNGATFTYPSTPFGQWANSHITYTPRPKNPVVSYERRIAFAAGKRIIGGYVDLIQAVRPTDSTTADEFNVDVMFVGRWY